VSQGRVADGPARRFGVRWGELWGSPDFLTFWAGETVSQVGAGVTTLALPLTAVLALGATPQQLGVLQAAQFLPFLLFSLVFGVAMDRRRRRPAMIVANAGRAVLVGLVPVLAALGELRLAALYVIVFGVGTLTTLFDVSMFSYVPTLVRDRRHLVEANGKVAASISAATIAGPGLAGFLVQALSAPITLTVNALSYAISVATLLLIRAEEPRPDAAGGRRHLRREVGEGFGVILRSPYLRVTALQGAMFNFCFQFVTTVFVLRAIREIHLSSVALGLILAAGSVGGLLGVSVAPPLTRRFPVGPLLTVAMVVGSVPSVLLAAAGGPPQLAAVLLVPAFLGFSAGAGVSNVILVSLRMAVTPNRLLGRVNGSMRLVLYGAIPLGALAAGDLGAAIGLRGALWVAAAGFILSLVPVVLSPIPRLRAMPALDADRGAGIL
jgi:MFS family permease